MSHFLCLVIGPDPEKQLAPYHEFECTGRDDEYVVEVDQTEEARESYETDTVLRLRDPAGALHDPFDAAGNFKEEFVRQEKPGDRRSLKVPEGWEQVRPLAKEHESFAQWASGYYGRPLRRPQESAGNYKYGWIEVDEAGEVVRVVDRTNPNARWDWYALGGRWTGFLKLKPTARVYEVGKPGIMTEPAKPGCADACFKCDVDFEGMESEARAKAQAEAEKVRAAVGSLQRPKPFEEFAKGFDSHDAAAKAFRAHPWVQAVKEALGGFFFGDPVKQYGDLERYVRSQSYGAWVPFAIVKDSQWFERGKMGWWGAVHDEQDIDTWREKAREMILALPDDTLLSVYDCHI